MTKLKDSEILVIQTSTDILNMFLNCLKMGCVQLMIVLFDTIVSLIFFKFYFLIRRMTHTSFCGESALVFVLLNDSSIECHIAFSYRIGTLSTLKSMTHTAFCAESQLVYLFLLNDAKHTAV